MTKLDEIKERIKYCREELGLGSNATAPVTVGDLELCVAYIDAAEKWRDNSIYSPATRADQWDQARRALGLE